MVGQVKAEHVKAGQASQSDQLLASKSKAVVCPVRKELLCRRSFKSQLRSLANNRPKSNHGNRISV